MLTAPAGVTIRTQCSSVMYKTPSSVAVIPIGRLNAAFVLIPSANAAAPEPANVLTIPIGVIARTRWLLPSATYKVPLIITIPKTL